MEKNESIYPEWVTALQMGEHALQREDYRAAMAALLPCAEMGIADAEAIVGLLYMLGQGVDRDIRKAKFFLKRAAAQGNGVAAHNLGTLYLVCEPEIRINQNISRKWFKRALELGFAPGTSKID